MKIRYRLTRVSLLQKARFLTNLTVASREKETGLLTVLTFFQWSHGFTPILENGWIQTASQLVG